MKEVIIHVGYAKCASTFLQNNIFPNIKGFEYIRGNKLRSYLNNTPNYLYDNDEAINLLGEFYHNNEKIIISDEGFLNIAESITPSLNWDRTCERLHRIFPNAKILISGQDFERPKTWRKYNDVSDIVKNYSIDK